MKNINDLKNIIKNTNVIFFDLDGTLIDTEPLYFRFWKESCSFYGYKLKDEEALSMRSRDSSTGADFLKEISNGLLDYTLVRNKRIELMNEYFKTHPIQMKKGAIPLLDKLQKEGKKLYVVTANTVEKATDIISSLHFEHFFTKIISAKDVKRGKPFPDVYLKACDIVGVKPEEVIVFEDSPNGLKSSHSAGCFTIMVEDLSNYSSDMDYVDGVLESLEELL